MLVSLFVSLQKLIVVLPFTKFSLGASASLPCGVVARIAEARRPADEAPQHDHDWQDKAQRQRGAQNQVEVVHCLPPLPACSLPLIVQVEDVVEVDEEPGGQAHCKDNHRDYLRDSVPLSDLH